MSSISTKQLSKIGGEQPPNNIHISKKAEQESQNEYNEVKNQGQLKKVFHFCFLGILIIGFALLASVLVVRVLHLIIPQCNNWLTEEQINGLDKLLFSGALGGLIGKHLNKAVE